MVWRVLHKLFGESSHIHSTLCNSCAPTKCGIYQCFLAWLLLSLLELLKWWVENILDLNFMRNEWKTCTCTGKHMRLKHRLNLLISCLSVILYLACVSVLYWRGIEQKRTCQITCFLNLELCILNFAIR